jgi:2-keto-4-pentenoate hydratase/2-oxohepta-3-ene-1,7-dioic acid hydratase in catechol pathway
VGAVAEGRFFAIADVVSIKTALADWDAVLDRVGADLEAGRLGEGVPSDRVTFLPPVPDAPNLYMAGANYADHTREMRKLPPDAPIERPPAGPFFFLKPTSTQIGHRCAVVRPSVVNRLDWEVELAAVIGRHAHHVPASHALEYVAGYTVVNDVSARDRFMREGSEPAMTNDWLGQKGWHTTCPAGPWLVPARDCPNPGDLAMRLTLNDELMQDSRTSEMIFPLEEQIEYLSRIVPLVPGDMICTGTCAGVGMGRGRFLAAGDVMVAEIEAIGALENAVVDETEEAG